jgi:hypothetical protein
MDKNSLLYWYPKLVSLGIPMPKTEILEIPFEDFLEFLNGKLNLCQKYDSEIDKLTEKIAYPLFMRTDLASEKHDWENTCYIRNKIDIIKNCYLLIDSNFMSDLAPSALIFREYIPLVSSFTAFYGKMPVAKERRYFIKDGMVIAHHEYWVEDAIRNPLAPDGEDWKELLRELNYEHPDEIIFLTKQAEKVAKIFDDYWSVDFALGKDGIWYLIDMARGEDSWRKKE